MNFINDLNSNSSDRNTLSAYLNKNVDLAYDFFISQSYFEIKTYRNSIDHYIFQNLNVLKKLDLAEKPNSTFILCLLEASERLGLTLYFQRLYKLLQNAGIEISLRLQAARMYLSGMRNLTDFQNALEPILEKLEEAYIIEEDSIDKVVLTITKFYTTIIDSFGAFNPKGVSKFKTLLINAKNDFPFLKNETVSDILAVKLENHAYASEKIHQILDNFLIRRKFVYPFQKGKILIETDTEYSRKLNSGSISFAAIRNLSAQSYIPIKDDSIFRSLGRGVEILTSEQQLLAYMYGYGKMHYAKINEGFNALPNDIVKKSFDLIDWGCGQGLGSLSFLDYYSLDTPSERINSLILIEPSEMALKRGALHLHKFDDQLDLVTLNKDLDSLELTDFKNCDKTPNIHILSNILDIDAFSLSDLLSLIKKVFKGENYFVIASPYINELKTDRIDRFVESFNENEAFQLLLRVNRNRGEWRNGWTMVLRVFKVKI